MQVWNHVPLGEYHSIVNASPLSPFTTTKVLTSLYNDVIQLIHWYEKPSFLMVFKEVSN